MLTETTAALADPVSEERLIGVLLSNPQQFPDLVAGLGHDSDVFTNAIDGLIYQSALDLQASGVTPEGGAIVSVIVDGGRSKQLLARVQYFHEVYGGFDPMCAENLGYFMSQVSDCFTRRRIQTLGLTVAHEAGDGSSVESLLGSIHDGVAALTEKSGGKDTHIAAHFEVMCLKMSSPELDDRIPMKPENLADKVPHMHPGDMIVIAGNTSVGKSALAMNIAWQSCMAERLPVVYLSLEMTEEQVTQRITAMLSGVSLSRITNPSTMSKLNWQAVSAVAADVEAMPFHIVYQPTMLIDEAMNTARMYHNRHGKLGCIVLDYLQFMRSDSNTTRNEEVSKYSVRMKQLAGDLGTTSIVVSQLNRQSGGGAPELSHLRDSGSIEQDADVVMMIEKPCLDDDDGYGSREMVVHVRKNRQGETGTADLTFLPNLMRWK